jgi:hypothetical protein
MYFYYSWSIVSVFSSAYIQLIIQLLPSDLSVSWVTVAVVSGILPYKCCNGAPLWNTHLHVPNKNIYGLRLGERGGQKMCYLLNIHSFKNETFIHCHTSPKCGRDDVLSILELWKRVIFHV